MRNFPGANSSPPLCAVAFFYITPPGSAGVLEPLKKMGRAPGLQWSTKRNAQNVTTPIFVMVLIRRCVPQEVPLRTMEVNSGCLTYCASGLLPLALAFGRCQAGCIRLARDPLTSPTLSAPDLINCT